ncbi:ABC transporter ATP-binding protein [Mycetocola reblochoni]|uniref:Alpha-glucoside transport ATP-binding protein AglK n=2 Tax=Mycetocola reblochoni TaxID=331618 RepID=A0A1R4JXV1_9MICO|nr:ABC transporter ATP-binding protein [Mycetocola reblochoni]SJN36819.1 Alpha-glucoside transport ATP-binding protein AglK [Mycetocola reblochoni REB411]
MGELASMGGARGPGGPRNRVSGSDEDAQRRANEDAPVIPGLGRRIAALFRPHRRGLVAVVALVLVGAGLSVVPPLLVQEAFDVGLFPADGRVDLRALAVIVGVMIAVFVVSAGLSVAQTRLTAGIGNSVMGSLRVQLFERLQSMELGFFTRTKTGVIQSRLQNDVGGVAGVLTNSVQNILGNTVTVIAAIVAMLLINWQLTLVAVVLMPGLVLVQRRVGRVRARIATRTQESLSEMTSITQEALSISGVLLAKSFNRQAREVARYQDENGRQVRLQVQQAMSGQWFFALVNVFLSSIPAVIYLVAGWLITGGATDITAGAIVAFTTVQSRLLFPLVSLMRVALDVQTSQALFARIFEYLDLTPSIVDADDAVDVPEGPASVVFRDVEFRYPDAAPGAAATLSGVSVDIEPGSFVGVVGPSGAGKTTISALIPRFQDVTAGAVEVGGVDVRKLTQSSLIDRIGLVSQESYLFHASIADNLRYARPDASGEELVAACTAANIHDTISSFPDGYDTLVGERGYRLSGGEKQRLAIARVLLKDPEILLLDEATSALDSISERIVQRALDTASHGRTTIAIAHRLSTVQHADRILVIDAGRLVESGTHPELLARGGVYSRLFSEQNG